MQQTTRRSWIASTVGATVAVGAPRGWTLAASQAAIRGANDSIRAAVVGFRGHGRTHINAYRRLPGVRMAALCDADRAVLQRGLDDAARNGEQVKGYVDVRRLLDDKDIDVVSTATPNHWHALVTVWACQAGKDVCVEKPVSHSVWEGRKMVEAARKYGRIVQGDLDLRSREGMREAVAYVRRGELGKIVLVRGCCYKRRKSLGKVEGEGQIPSSVDYDLWCGPATKGPLRRKTLHYEWHWVWDTGNGELGNNGPHQLDVCRWVLGEQGLPTRVMSLGGRYGYDDDGETPNTQITFYEYPRAPIIYEVRGLGRTGGDDVMDAFRARSSRGLTLTFGQESRSPTTGVVVECEHGYVDLDGLKVYDRKGQVITQFSRGSSGPQERFIQAVRSRRIEDIRTDILQGHLSTCLCHMGNISYRVGSKADPGEVRELLAGDKDALETYGRCTDHLGAHGIDLKESRLTLGPWLSMNSPAERFTGPFADAANALCRRNYRTPFVIPERV